MVVNGTVLLEIRNLRALADEHHRICRDQECDISTSFVLVTAMRLLPLLDAKDRIEADRLVKDWPV